ncbi:MAG: ABC transporter permease [Alphaproteobacteria bacterium]|nr:ABC transporter permease [Alphaproteobacteria bacterium]
MHKKIIAILFLLTLWQLGVNLSGIPAYILPSPILITCSLIENHALLLKHTFISMAEIIVGLSIAVLLGTLSAILLDYFDRLKPLIKPILLTLQSTPPFVLMPVLLIWCGFGFTPKLIVICLSCYFPITVCLLDGLKRTPANWLDMASIMGASKKSTLRYIRLPAALPSLMSGIRLAAIHAPLTVLAADWIGASSGLGYLIMLSHGRLEIELMFACIVCITLMTFALNKGVTLLEKKLVFWPSTPS